MKDIEEQTFNKFMISENFLQGLPLQWNALWPEQWPCLPKQRQDIPPNPSLLCCTSHL